LLYFGVNIVKTTERIVLGTTNNNTLKAKNLAAAF